MAPPVRKKGTPRKGYRSIKTPAKRADDETASRILGARNYIEIIKKQDDKARQRARKSSSRKKK